MKTVLSKCRLRSSGKEIMEATVVLAECYHNSISQFDFSTVDTGNINQFVVQIEFKQLSLSYHMG